MPPSDIAPPHMSANCIAAITQQLEHTQTYLEFGMGGSTTLAAKIGVEHIISVDSSQEWIAKVSADISKTESKSRLIQLLHANIGEIGDWGHPKDSSMIHNWPSYFYGPWTFLNQQKLNPETVLIDGRFRISCFLYSLINLKSGSTIMWDDYVSRHEYHIVENILKPEKTIDEMAIFRRPESIDIRSVLDMLFQYLYAQG